MKWSFIQNTFLSVPKPTVLREVEAVSVDSIGVAPGNNEHEVGFLGFAQMGASPLDVVSPLLYWR